MEARGVLKEGKPHQMIVDTAKEENADLIIITTHGHTGFRHLTLGSVAEKVVRRSPCPVLSVHVREKEFVKGSRSSATTAT